MAVLKAMQDASGGERWANVTSLHMKMTVAGEGQLASGERWEDVSAGRYIERDFWPDYTAQDGFDGITLWHQGRSGIAYTLGDVDAGLVAADESFRVSRAWWFSERHAATAAIATAQSENGRNFDVISITPEGGRVFQAWIDKATHLLARTDEQQAEDRVVTTYSNYRRVDGLMLPFTVRVGDGVDPSFDQIESIQSFDINIAVPTQLYAIPSRPASDIDMPPGRDSVDLPFRLTASNRIMVPLVVNGRDTVQAEFDSGGSLILQPAALAKMGIMVRGRSKQSGGGEGATTASSGRLKTIALGAATVNNIAFHSFALSSDEPDTAILGLEILQRFVVRFDFDRQIMTLTKPEAFGYSGKGAIIPFRFQDNQPEIKGAVDGIAGLFTIDTGDSGSLLLIAPFARKYSLVDRYHADIPYDGKAVSATHGVWARKRVAIVSFDGPDGRPVAEAHEPITRISLQHAGFDANRNVSASIGLGILRQFNLTIDYRRQRLILEPNHQYDQKDIFNRAGISLRRLGTDWVVNAVYPHSPAADAQLKVGDRIVKIDNKSADELGPDDLSVRLKAKIGSMLQLKVIDSGDARTVNLVLRDII